MMIKIYITITAVLQLTNANPFDIQSYNNFNKVNIKFYNGFTSNIYTQYSMQNLTKILHAKEFNPDRQTVLFVFGWMQSATAETTLLMINGYLKYKDCNLLLLDWSDYSAGLLTPVMFRISKISLIVGRYLEKLFKGGLRGDKFHCVGHSFGSHSCGIMGRELQQVSNKKYKFGRITGLDPAGPGFFPPLYLQPLGKDDANFVDTIHSDVFLIGTKVPLGHVSFFPNYNSIQPGCPKFSLHTFFDFVNDMCSHFHAIRYYVETLNPKNSKIFPSFRCSDWKQFENKKCEKNPINYMGIEANSKIKGNFFVTVTSKRFFDGVEFYNWLIERIGNRLDYLVQFYFSHKKESLLFQ